MKFSVFFTGLFAWVCFAQPANAIPFVVSSDPVLSVDPGNGEFGAIQLGEARSLVFTLRNSGDSLLKINGIRVIGEGFDISDSTQYPIELIGASEVGLIPGNHRTYMQIRIYFIPTEPLVYSGKVLISQGSSGEVETEILLTGKGISCRAAAIANNGENIAPLHNCWYQYTADRFMVFQLTSCHPLQPGSKDVRWNLYLMAYSDCSGTIIHEQNEWTDCPNDRYAVDFDWVLEKGETLYMKWYVNFPENNRPSGGFRFTIVPYYIKDGDICETAIPLTLPVVNQFGNTRDYHYDYTASPCSPVNNYMGGNDIIYSITLQQEGYLVGSIIGSYASIHVLDACPRELLYQYHCKAFAGGPQGGDFRKKIQAGTYYVFISNWSPPQSVDFLLNLSFQGISGTSTEDLSTELKVWPNPVNSILNISAEMVESSTLTFELVNLSGQVVTKSSMVASGLFCHELDVSGLPAGIYCLRTIGPGWVINKRVIIG